MPIAQSLLPEPTRRWRDSPGAGARAPPGGEPFRSPEHATRERGESAMIGALLAQRGVRRTYEALNDRDLDRFLARLGRGRHLHLPR